MNRLLAVAALTSLIHLINTLIYSVRVSGVRTGRLATALSLFNIIFLLSSTANMLQGPILATMVEGAILRGGMDNLSGAIGKHVDFPPRYTDQISMLALDFRLVLLSATLGTILGALLIPSFIDLFTRAIYVFEKKRSVAGMLITLIFSFRLTSVYLRECSVRPQDEKGAVYSARGLPALFLVMNVVVTGIFSTGVLSALYAGALYPGYRTSATMLASLVNGVAQVLFATMVDPSAASITDQALQGRREQSDVRKMAFYLAGTRLVGTLLAQAILFPAACLIRFVAVSIT